MIASTILNVNFSVINAIENFKKLGLKKKMKRRDNY